jgi:ribonuclease P protein component
VPQSLKAIEIVKGYGAFTQIITKGKRFEKKPLKAFVKINGSSSDIARVGFTVSKSVQTAVERNRLKRLMREAVYNHTENKTVLLRDILGLEIVIMYIGDKELVPKRVRFSSIQNAIQELLLIIAKNK